MNARLAGALMYLEVGWPVFPIKPLSKAPLTEHGFKDATLLKMQVKDWWHRWPDANVGIATGKQAGITVIDLDGKEGIETARRLNLPPTWTVVTPHGAHLFYQYDPRPKQGVKRQPGIDVRSDGGYVVAPPSVTECDKGHPPHAMRYRPPMPEKSITLPAEPQPLGDYADLFATSLQPSEGYSEYRDPAWVVRALQGVSEGLRNQTAASLAGYFHRKGVSSGIALAILEDFAHRCTPPIPLIELRRTVESVDRYPVQIIEVKDLPDDSRLLR